MKFIKYITITIALGLLVFAQLGCDEEYVDYEGYGGSITIKCIAPTISKIEFKNESNKGGIINLSDSIFTLPIDPNSLQMHYDLELKDGSVSTLVVRYIIESKGLDRAIVSDFEIDSSSTYLGLRCNEEKELTDSAAMSLGFDCINNNGPGMPFQLFFK